MSSHWTLDIGICTSARRDGEGEGEALWFLGNFLTIKVCGVDTRGQLTVIGFVNPAGFAPRARETGEAASTPGLPPTSPMTEHIGALTGIAPRYDMEVLRPPPW